MSQVSSEIQSDELEDSATEAQSQQPDAISIQDLQALLQIVDVASSRGAFRGAELTQVGAVFDKLNAFLTYIAEQQQAAEADAETEAE